MVEKLTQEMVWQFIQLGDEDFDLEALRNRHEISADSSTFYMSISRFLADKKIRRLGRGRYHRVKRVDPIYCFGEPISEPFTLYFPRDFDTMMEMSFADDLIIREGDLILISGRSNFGKTQMCLSFAGENIDANPVLMGNEYTTLDNKPTPRFLTRIRNMDWIHWQDDNGKQKFTLLPVRSDYAEHIVKDRINIIDWINIETGEHYMIGTVMESIKREVGRGVGIIAIQKAENAEAGRGGQFTKDFADIEILLDKLPESDDVLLTIGKVKESRHRVTGRTFAYGIFQGVKIKNFREVVKCGKCYGKGWVKEGNSSKPCPACNKQCYIDK